MKVILRTNEDDWRELEVLFDGELVLSHAGHDVPEFVWLEILDLLSINVEIVIDNFGVKP